MSRKLLVILLSSLAVSAIAFARHHDEEPAGGGGGLRNAIVLIIRHAEKPESGFTLSPDGERRANAYVKYFSSFAVDGRPFPLEALYSTADSEGSHRPRLTIEPLSKALGLKIDDRFKDKEVAEFVKDLEAKPHGKHILICWHHGEIPALLHAFGADPGKLLPDGKWPSHIFGWVMELHFDGAGQLADAKRIEEHLMPDDAEK